MNGKRIAGIVLGGFLALAGSAFANGHGHGQGSGLGDGRGIDHVAVLVRPENFDSAAIAFSEDLGFSLTAALLSPLGAKNRLIWFDDLSYFEVVTLTEANPFTQPFLDFLAVHEGGKYYGSEVQDVNQALTFLNGAGYPAVGPVPAPPLTIESTGDVVGLTPLWQSAILTSRVAPDNSNFFLQYDDALMLQMFADFPVVAPHPHANTAQRIDALWMVVSDLDDAIDFYEGLGLQVTSKHQKIHYLGGRGAEVRYRNSTLRLLEPDGPGIVADFAAVRGQGILGASIKVGNLATARALIQGNTGITLQPFKYKGRNRFLIPTHLTHDFLMEMVE